MPIKPRPKPNRLWSCEVDIDVNGHTALMRFSLRARTKLDAHCKAATEVRQVCSRIIQIRVSPVT